MVPAWASIIDVPTAVPGHNPSSSAAWTVKPSPQRSPGLWATLPEVWKQNMILKKPKGLGTQLVSIQQTDGVLLHYAAGRTIWLLISVQLNIYLNDTLFLRYVLIVQIWVTLNFTFQISFSSDLVPGYAWVSFMNNSRDINLSNIMLYCYALLPVIFCARYIWKFTNIIEDWFVQDSTGSRT